MSALRLVMVVLAAAAVGCQGPQPEESAEAAGTLLGTVVAGPTCPVERDPPDPACALQPVAGALIVLTDGSGSEVARAESDEDGQFDLALPPGRYILVPQPVEGYMGTAVEQEVVVEADALVEVEIAYDTGIR